MRKKIIKTKIVVCSKCGKNIKGKYKKRVNYPHGTKSKPIVTYFCKKCQK